MEEETASGDWDAAASEMRASAWYQQVRRRTDQDIGMIAACGAPPAAATGDVARA